MLTKRQEVCDILAKKIAELHFHKMGYAWGNSLGEYTNYDGVAYDAATKKEYKVECKFRHSTSINDYPTLYIKERKIELLNQWAPDVKLVYVWKDAYAVLSLDDIKRFPVENKLVRENQASYNDHMERCNSNYTTFNRYIRVRRNAEEGYRDIRSLEVTSRENSSVVVFQDFSDRIRETGYITYEICQVLRNAGQF